jgi:hypothetical protein
VLYLTKLDKECPATRSITILQRPTFLSSILVVGVLAIENQGVSRSTDRACIRRCGFQPVLYCGRGGDFRSQPIQSTARHRTTRSGGFCHLEYQYSGCLNHGIGCRVYSYGNTFTDKHEYSNRIADQYRHSTTHPYPNPAYAHTKPIRSSPGTDTYPPANSYEYTCSSHSYRYA